MSTQTDGTTQAPLNEPRDLTGKSYVTVPLVEHAEQTYTDFGFEKMKAYIINMPDAVERRRKLEGVFATLSLRAVFVEAVVGKEIKLPDQRYNERRYRMAHGKKTNLAELGCYFSHIKALSLFLESDDDYTLILEDDIELDHSFERILAEALEYNEHFDLLRLSGLHVGTPVGIISLKCGYKLSCNYSRQTGSGAYLVNRHAASQMVKALIPMWLPFDHAFDREWLWGVTAMCLHPMPVRQNIGFESQINAAASYKIPAVKRYFTVFPYRAYNEISRVVARTFCIIKKKCKR